MTKRKNSISSEEESEHEDSNQSDTSDAPISGKSAGKKKSAGNPTKKPKLTVNKETKEEQSEKSADDSDEIKVHVNADGEKYIDLGKKKRAVVRSFKGIALLDIREFYGADGEEKPGKKGISLTLDQWKLLSEGSSIIDKLFEEQKKKK